LGHNSPWRPFAAIVLFYSALFFCKQAAGYIFFLTIYMSSRRLPVFSGIVRRPGRGALPDFIAFNEAWDRQRNQYFCSLCTKTFNDIQEHVGNRLHQSKLATRERFVRPSEGPYQSVATAYPPGIPLPYPPGIPLPYPPGIPLPPGVGEPAEGQTDGGRRRKTQRRKKQRRRNSFAVRRRSRFRF
jgi:hypothetical protein